MASAIDQLNGLGTLVNAISGSSSKTKQTQTTQTNISDAGVNELIRQILSGPGGVKSIGTAARSSGLYNSTTEDQALGELYSSAATKAELARSPTTTSSTTQQTTPGLLGGSGLGTIGGLIAGGTLLNTLSNGAIGDSIGNIVGSLFGGGGGAAAAESTGSLLSGALSSGVSDTLGGLVPAGAAGSLGAEALGGSALGEIGSALGGAAPVIGNFLGGLMGGKDASTDPMNLATSAALGAAALGPVGLIAAPIASIAGGLLGDSVVCTELAKLGDISVERHRLGEDYLNSRPPIMKVGYWTWGIPVASKIRKGSKFWRYFTRPIVRQYIELVIRKDRIWKDYVELPLGSLAYFIGEPFCTLVGKIVIKWDILTTKVELRAK